MENHGHRRLRDLLFLLLILALISLIPAISSALSTEQEPDLAFKETMMIAQNEDDEDYEDEEIESFLEEVKPPDIQEEVPVKPAPPKPERKPADVSFFFDDADVYEVIQTIFGEVLKVNYIVDPKIKGRVNFRTTTPIPKGDVLSVMEIILRLNGIAIVEEKGLYRIIAITDIPKEPAPIRFGRDPGAVELKGVAIVQVVQLQDII